MRLQLDNLTDLVSSFPLEPLKSSSQLINIILFIFSRYDNSPSDDFSFYQMPSQVCATVFMMRSRQRLPDTSTLSSADHRIEDEAICLVSYVCDFVIYGPN